MPFGQSWVVGTVFGKIAKGATYGVLRGIGMDVNEAEKAAKVVDMSVSQVSATVVGVLTLDPIGVGAASVQNYGIARDIEEKKK